MSIEIPDGDERDELARLEREGGLATTLVRLRDRLADPAVAARVAAAQRERAAREAAEATALADLRGVPAADDVRAAVLDAAALPTEALKALRPLRDRTAHVVRDGRQRPGVIVLLGSPGQGKTVALGRAVLRHPRSARYLTAADVVAPNGHSEARRAWADLLAPDLLALDEVGRETHAPGVLVELLMARWAAGRFSVLASNLDPRAFGERYRDDALRDRIATQGFRASVVLAGPSLRRAP